MKKLIIPMLFLAIILLASCGKELTTPIVPDKVAIVESYLYTGDSVITIKVTKLLPYSDDTTDAVEYISGLHLQINGSDLTETRTGIYTLPLGTERIQSGETYVLKFQYFSDTVSSITTVPDKPVNFSISSNTIYADRITSAGGGMPSGPPADITLSWDNPDGSYYYVVIEYLESTRDYINYRSKSLDLSDTTSIAPTNASETRLGTRNLYFFGSYRIVLFKVNKDFADLYQQTAVNSNNIITPVTNINNGFGVFTGMAGDTVYLEVLEN
jgi:hypothetical protein